jgi:8-oxo-dGTP pyrophosphatase MutT (NUDIX family)
MRRAIQRFQVSLKAAIVRDERLLLLQEADTGFWELPGGRIDVGEERLPQTDVLLRELREELGASMVVEPLPAAVTWVRFEPREPVHQLLIARHCRWLGGDMVLSEEHADLRWTQPSDWQALAFPPHSDYQDGLARLWSIVSS